ncbi:hypothetical protein MC885_011908, partial [Smutsia gigantea]
SLLLNDDDVEAPRGPERPSQVLSFTTHHGRLRAAVKADLALPFIPKREGEQLPLQQNPVLQPTGALKTKGKSRSPTLLPFIPTFFCSRCFFLPDQAELELRKPLLVQRDPLQQGFHRKRNIFYQYSNSDSEEPKAKSLTNIFAGLCHQLTNALMERKQLLGGIGILNIAKEKLQMNTYQLDLNTCGPLQAFCIMLESCKKCILVSSILLDNKQQLPKHTSQIMVDSLHPLAVYTISTNLFNQ